MSPSRYRAPSPYSADRAQAPAPSGPVKTTLMRRYEMLYLDHDHVPAARAPIAPATALFESAFSAFARGTLIKTAQGTCAIEDLQPGTLIETEEFGPQPMVWRGMMNIIPNAVVDCAAAGSAERRGSRQRGVPLRCQPRDRDRLRAGARLPPDLCGRAWL